MKWKFEYAYPAYFIGDAKVHEDQYRVYKKDLLGWKYLFIITDKPGFRFYCQEGESAMVTDSTGLWYYEGTV